MNKRNVIATVFLLFLFVFLITSRKEVLSRGLVRVKTSVGKEIELYEKSYALVIGNGDYRNGWDPLPGALRDSEEVAKALGKMGFEVTWERNVPKERFESLFGTFVRKHGGYENNRLLFYYAGHGHTEKISTEEELGYIVMVDAPLPERDPVAFDKASVDMVSIVTQSKKIRARHVLFMFDSCFSGTILNLRDRVIPEPITDMVRYPVRQFITAGRANESVPDYSRFKQAFLDLISGLDKEPIPDGYITGEELGLYLKTKVPEYNKVQHPQYGKINDPKLNKGDFVFPLRIGAGGGSTAVKLPAAPEAPGASGFDVSKYMQIADEHKEVREKWEKQLAGLKTNYNELLHLEKRDIPAKIKISAWREFLNDGALRQDNPYTVEDEEIRRKAEERITYWEVEEERISEELKKRAEDEAKAKERQKYVSGSGKAGEVGGKGFIAPDSAIPPELYINYPHNHSQTTDAAIQLHGSIVTFGRGNVVPQLSVYLNDKPLRVVPASEDFMNEKNLIIKKEEYGGKTIFDGHIILSSGENEIKIIGKDRNNLVTEKIIKVTRNMKLGNIYAVVIGISNFFNEEYNLKYAASDAEKFYRFLRSENGGEIQGNHIKFLTDSRATKAGVIEALTKFMGRATTEDTVEIYIVTHGIIDTDGRFYYLCYDSDTNNLRGTSLFDNELTDIIRKDIKAGKVILYIDVCHAGRSGLSERYTRRGLEVRERNDRINSLVKESERYTRRGLEVRELNDRINSLVKELSKHTPGVAAFSASSAEGYSQEGTKWNGGVFTHCLIKGLKGEANADNDEWITIKELEQYLTREVRALTNGKQCPKVDSTLKENTPVSKVY